MMIRHLCHVARDDLFWKVFPTIHPSTHHGTSVRRSRPRFDVHITDRRRLRTRGRGRAPGEGCVLLGTCCRPGCLATECGAFDRTTLFSSTDEIHLVSAQLTSLARRGCAVFDRRVIVLLTCQSIRTDSERALGRDAVGTRSCGLL